MVAMVSTCNLTFPVLVITDGIEIEMISGLIRRCL
jgi:hypothetical protein